MVKRLKPRLYRGRPKRKRHPNLSRSPDAFPKNSRCVVLFYSRLSSVVVAIVAIMAVAVAALPVAIVLTILVLVPEPTPPYNGRCDRSRCS